MDKEFHNFLESYVACALWVEEAAQSDEDGNWTQDEFLPDQLAPETKIRMENDCREFFDKHYDVIARGDFGEAGHCFWLSRNGHGSNFLDSDFYDEVDRDTLQEAARLFGEQNLYRGDDGLLYLMQG